MVKSQHWHISQVESKVYPKGYEPGGQIDAARSKGADAKVRNQLLNAILQAAPTGQMIDDRIFEVMSKRRSTRRFESRPVEPDKIKKLIAAADTAPTAGNYQGFEIFHIVDEAKKEALVAACNNQRYVNAPLVLVFCKNPDRVKFDFPEETLKKFAIQDATLAAGYSQLAAQALGLSSIWIGMLDEKAVMGIIGTDLVPSSVLCIGYPQKQKYPKSRRNISDLLHTV